MARGRQAALNRPLFTQTAFESSALTVLTTLLHHFAEAGSYECLVRRDGRLVARIPIQVAAEHADRQVNIDLAKVGEDDRGCCAEHSGQGLAIGGVAGFYASRGTGRYTVSVTTMDSERRAKRTVLDNEKGVPEGDLFAVTLVQPGEYRLSNVAGKSSVDIRVRLPKAGGKYRPDQPRLLKLGKEAEFDRDSIQISSGQSVVVHCGVDAQLRVELTKPDDVGPAIGKGTFTFNRPKPRKPPR